MRPIFTAAMARAIADLARRHAAERFELQERHFEEMRQLAGDDASVEELMEVCRDAPR